MATYYVYSGAAGANTGGSWTDAFTSFASAVSAATTNGDLILVHKTHVQNVAANTTYTFAANVVVLCVDKDNGNALSEMDGTNYYVGHNSSAFTLTLTGAFRVFHYGFCYRTAGNASSGDLSIATTADGGEYIFERSKLWLTSTNSGRRINLGSNVTTAYNTFVRLIDCDYRFGNTAQFINTNMAAVEFLGGQINSAGSVPANFITPMRTTADILIEGTDLSYLGSNPILGDCVTSAAVVKATNCKLGSGYSLLASQTLANISSGEVFAYNCDSGDNHINFAHANALGALELSSSIYANDGAAPDGTNKISWKITTTAAASLFSPYTSPWIDRYNTSLSAMTPYFEILRDGSTAPYQDDEVWGEWSFQANSGSVLPAFKSDRMVLNGSPVDQASGVGLSGWTGESGSAWSGKLSPASSTTPAEIGYVRGRVLVGQPSITVYADPQIRI